MFFIEWFTILYGQLYLRTTKIPTACDIQRFLLQVPDFLRLCGALHGDSSTQRGLITVFYDHASISRLSFLLSMAWLQELPVSAVLILSLE